MLLVREGTAAAAVVVEEGVRRWWVVCSGDLVSSEEVMLVDGTRNRIREGALPRGREGP